MVPPAGLEPATHELGIRRSIHLSYGGSSRSLAKRIVEGLLRTLVPTARTRRTYLAHTMQFGGNPSMPIRLTLASAMKSNSTTHRRSISGPARSSVPNRLYPGRWITRGAPRKAAYWASSREKPCRLAVNISPLQFEQDDVFSVAVDALKRAGLPPELLDLKITESLLLRDDAIASQSTS